MFKFKPEDFKDFLYNEDNKKLLAEHCDALLEAHLKTLPRVYVAEPKIKENVYFCEWMQQKSQYDTHTALLFDVKEIEK